MRFTRVSTYLLLAGGLGLTLLTLGCGQESPMAPASPTATFEPAGKPSSGVGASKNFEVTYMQVQMDREYLIRQMALLCLQKQVDHPDLHVFADTAATNAGQNVATLQGYLNEWYGIQRTPALSGSGQRTLSNLSELEGAAFEKAFLTQMIKFDDLSVREGQRCYGRASHTMLIYFGFLNQYARAAEATILRQWLCSWFGVC